MLSVLIPPASTMLTTVGALRSELKLTTESNDPRLRELIADASEAVETHLDRVCARRQLRETTPGFGDTVLQLASPPVVLVTKLTHRGEVLLDYEIADSAAGHLYRERGWDWSASYAGRFGADPVIGSDRPDWGIEYFCGWLLPGDDYTSATIGADTADNSLNDSAGGLPLVVPGEWITVAGFTDSAVGNNGQAKVLSRTASKIVLDRGLVTQAEADARQISLSVRTLPRNIERATVLTASAWFQATARDPDITQKRVADTTISYGGASAVAPGALPPKALELLTRWVRVA